MAYSVLQSANVSQITVKSKNALSRPALSVGIEHSILKTQNSSLKPQASLGVRLHVHVDAQIVADMAQVRG